MTDDDDEAIEPRPLELGTAEGADLAGDDAGPHFRGLYIASLASPTGWAWHVIDHDEPPPPARPGAGFRPP